jgi:hypothetical protein
MFVGNPVTLQFPPSQRGAMRIIQSQTENSLALCPAEAAGLLLDHLFYKHLAPSGACTLSQHTK